MEGDLDLICFIQIDLIIEIIQVDDFAQFKSVMDENILVSHERPVVEEKKDFQAYGINP